MKRLVFLLILAAALVASLYLGCELPRSVVPSGVAIDIPDGI